MAWSASGIFGQTILDILKQTTAMDIDTDSFKIALFNNSVVPDYSATAANTAFDAGTWLVANEVSGTGWSSGGVNLDNEALTLDQPAAGQFFFDSDNVSETGTTLSNIYGCLVYDDTIASPVADQGFFAVQFSGAPYSTTNGTLTITVDANGWLYSDFTP